MTYASHLELFENGHREEGAGPLYLDGFGNRRFERSPRVTVAVHIGPACAVDVGRGVTLIGEQSFAWEERYGDTAAWVPDYRSYSTILRSDDRAPTDRMRSTFRDEARAHLPPAPTRADVDRLAQEAQQREVDRARDAFERAVSEAQAARLRVMEMVESGAIACER